MVLIVRTRALPVSLWRAGLVLATAGALVACSGGGTDVAGPVASAEPVPSDLPFVDWPQVYDQVETGVVRIAVIGCESSGTGSGFLVGDGLVATAAHVVEDSTVISVRAGTQVRGADVLGVDASADVALLRLSEPVDGHVFTWRDEAPRVGEDVAAIGYPRGRPLAMTKGAVTAVGRRIEVEGTDRLDFVQTDAALNPGNSGGPLVMLDGTAAGIVSAGSDMPGDGYAVSPSAAQAAVDGWLQQAEPVEASACAPDEERDYPDGVPPLQVAVSSRNAEAPSLAQTFRLHADAINRGEYVTAWELLTPQVRGRIGDVDRYADELESSFWTSLDVVDVEALDSTTDEVELRFRTLQDAEHGPDAQTCSDWHVQYRMVLDSGFWQIDRATSLDDPRDCSDEPAANGTADVTASGSPSPAAR